MRWKIPVDVRVPTTATAASPVPVLLLISGLDGYRTDQTSFVEAHLDRGFAVVGVDIHITGDSPAIRNDSENPDRLWSSVLDWIETQELMDGNRVLARGLSTGGYYAMRIAHTHKDRLVASVSHACAYHHMFDPRWIEKQNTME